MILKGLYKMSELGKSENIYINFEKSISMDSQTEKKKQKKDYNASVRISKQTRTELNALRKITKKDNIDKLIQEMIQDQLNKLNTHEKIKYKILIEE